MPSLEDEVAARINAAMARGGAAAVVAIQNEISEPYPPSSDPNTPPHLRTGRLRAGIDSTTEPDGTTTISSEASYSAALKYGRDGIAARDFFGDDMIARITPIFTAAAQTEFS